MLKDLSIDDKSSSFNELEIFTRNFNGLSTRHLQEYLDWFKCLKIMKYTLEYLKREEKLYKFTISQKK